MAIAFDQSVTQNLGEVIGREWLETNGLGGWASSTIANIHTRRYHGLLVAATQPPVGRVVLLSKLDETLMRGDVRRELGSNVYPGAVHPHLLTPVGLRSLAPHDPAFNPTYQGNAYQRDAAYHQGTVWAWLLGPYLTALVKVRGKTGRKQGLKLMPAVQDHLSTSGIGQISEIFDGDPPTPQGGAWLRPGVWPRLHGPTWRICWAPAPQTRTDGPTCYKRGWRAKKMTTPMMGCSAWASTRPEYSS